MTVRPMTESGGRTHRSVSLIKFSNFERAVRAMDRKIVSATYLAELTGTTARHWQKLAADKKLPFAKQPSGAGTAWYFELAGFELWLENNGEMKQWQPSRKFQTSGGEANGRGEGSKFAEKTSDTPLIQRIRELRASGSSSGSKASKPPSGARSPDAPMTRLPTGS